MTVLHILIAFRIEPMYIVNWFEKKNKKQKKKTIYLLILQQIRLTFLQIAVFIYLSR